MKSLIQNALKIVTVLKPVNYNYIVIVYVIKLSGQSIFVSCLSETVEHTYLRF